MPCIEGEQIQVLKAKISKVCDTETFSKISTIIDFVANGQLEVINPKQEIVPYELSYNLQLVQKWLLAKTIQGCTKKTLTQYRIEVTKFANKLTKDIREVTADEIRYYLAYMQSLGNCNMRNLDNTRRCISSFYGWLHEEDYITHNPMRKIKKIKFKKQVKTAFTAEEIERLKIECNNFDSEAKRKRNLAIVVFMLSTGVRAMELGGIKMTDVNWDTNTVRVLGKGNKERDVYMTAEAKLLTQEYLKTKPETEYLFTSLFRPYNKLEVSGIEILIRELGRKAGVEECHPHKFRRTCATIANKRGMQVTEIQKMLGHEALTTTQIYLEVGDETVKESHKRYLN